MSVEGRERSPYNGNRRELVVAIDFGTTYSGVSYAFLEPGLAPKVRSVTGFRGQEDQDSSTKVPTVLLYNKAGRLCAAGAETNDPETIEQAEVSGWTRLSWFKLLLRPRDTDDSLEDAPIPSLPRRKTIESVLSDFLGYMNNCARDYITRTHADGAKLLKEVDGYTTYVLSHPNGWHGFQQSKMREAAILAGLVSPTDEGKARIRFVSEGEASFHWCIESGLARESMLAGCQIIVADAGGGTIDVSSFKVISEKPFRLEETHASECRLAGSVFVTQAFANYTQDLLAGSAYGDEETLRRLRAEFDNKNKRLFRDDTRMTSVTFGGARDHSPALNIRAGKLNLKREQVIPFFEKSCSAAVDTICCHVSRPGRAIVYLVGGFAASSYLFSEIQRRLKNQSVEIKRAESHTAKAVADGAVCFFLDSFISARIAKCTYGVKVHRHFNSSLQSHLQRRHKIYVDTVDGIVKLPDGFTSHVVRGTVVKETSVTKIPLETHLDSNSTPYQFNFKLYSYKGDRKDIIWVDEDSGAFSGVCTFSGSVPISCFRRKQAPSGSTYWEIRYDAVVSFGTTEFTCYIEWIDDKGAKNRGPTSAVWEEA